jgi:hypothetical protein
MGKIRKGYKFLFGKPGERNDSKDLGVNGKIILERILEKQGGKMWT